MSVPAPRTSPEKSDRKSPLVTRALGEIRGELIVALSATNITIAALRVQAAHIDTDAAVVLRQCVADKIDRLIQKISELLARGVP
jgi:hypothetical protein